MGVEGEGPEEAFGGGGGGGAEAGEGGVGGDFVVARVGGVDEVLWTLVWWGEIVGDGAGSGKEGLLEEWNSRSSWRSVWPRSP